MIRTLRAFAWLKWRVALHAIDSGGGRDLVARFSVALEQLAPVVMALVMVPSALALGGAGASAAASLAAGAPTSTSVEVTRFALLAGCVLAVISPLLFPGGGQQNVVRLLLLPISSRVLYLSQAVSALAEPWMLLVAALLVAVPLGLAAGGSIGGAVFALLTGVVFLLGLAALSLIASSMVRLLARNRQRAELLTLVLLLALPVVGLAPSLLERGRDSGAIDSRPGGSEGQQPWWVAIGDGARRTVPSEVYMRGVRSSAGGDTAGALRAALVLAAFATVAHGAALATFAWLLRSPDQSGRDRTGGSRPPSVRRIPGFSPAASAVARNQVRLALRTARGRFTVLSPLVLFAIGALLMFRSSTGGAEFGFIRLSGGIPLAAFLSVIALLAILPLAVNQFAIDRAGLTLALLAPLETAALLHGKALGNALVAAIPAGLCVAGARLLFPAGHPALWLSLPLAIFATYLLLAPAAAALSMIFPRAVDLSSIGRGSNAHGIAVLLGTVTIALSAACCALLVGAASALHRPALAPVFLLAWTLACGAAHVVLFRWAARLFERRREQLGMMTL